MRTYLLIALMTVAAHAQPARRALLIGIDDYTASTLPHVAQTTPERQRGWPDLKGAANDVAILEEMLVLLYGFQRNDIVTLKNQQATRAAILQAIEQHLVRPARKGDVVFYYFAGHGAQVPNAASDELDGRDESIVPADSRRGADDIRDKELRPLFNRILERGAQLTLLLDHCHSGSGFRGAPSRGIAPARPIVDPKAYGPRPEERGALVLASAQDLDPAEETYGEDGKSHGAFTWAWIQAMRDAASGEPAQETFLRAQARLRVDKPHQAPAMLGAAAARLRPFLGTRIDRRGERAIVAVERVEGDGHVVLQGGWANGLAVDAELRPIGAAPTLRVTAMLGLGRSIARMKAGGAVPPSIRSGALLEIVRWAAPQGRPLRVWIPRDASVRIALGDGIVAVADPAHADYVLARRRTEYAWIRPECSDVCGSAWTSNPARLRADLLALRRIRAWHTLQSNTPSPYRLALRHEKTRQLVRGGPVLGGQTYSVVLRAARPQPARRYYYVFVVDSHGKSYLVYPRSGSVENRFPIAEPAPAEIALGPASAFDVMRPYGADTYFLLSTEEPLPNPSILEWDGLRAPPWKQPLSPLEELLWRTITGTRGRRTITTSRWSIERVTLESAAPANVGRASARPLVGGRGLLRGTRGTG